MNKYYESHTIYKTTNVFSIITYKQPQLPEVYTNIPVSRRVSLVL